MGGPGSDLGLMTPASQIVSNDNEYHHFDGVESSTRSKTRLQLELMHISIAQFLALISWRVPGLFSRMERMKVQAGFGQ